MASTTRQRPPRAISIAARLGQTRVASRLEGEVRVTAADLVDSVAEAKLKVAAVRFKVESEMRSKTEKLRNRVALLDPRHANPDMVDELVRRELNVAHPDEVIVPLK